MKARSFAGKSGETVSILGPAGAEDNIFLLVGAGAAKDFDAGRAQATGAAIYRALGALSIREAAVVAEAPKDTSLRPADLAACLAAGARLRSSAFDKYLTKRDNGEARNPVAKLTPL